MPQFVSKKQAASMAGVSRQAIHLAIGRGEIETAIVADREVIVGASLARWIQHPTRQRMRAWQQKGMPQRYADQ